MAAHNIPTDSEKHRHKQSSGPPQHSKYTGFSGSYHILQGGGPSVCGRGGARIFGVFKRGDQFFFSGPKGWTRIIRGSNKGGPEFFPKMGT